MANIVNSVIEDALLFLLNGNSQEAQKKAQIYLEYHPEQCDAHRIIGFTETNHVSSILNIYNLYDTVETFGELLAAVKKHTTNKLLDREFWREFDSVFHNSLDTRLIIDNSGLKIRNMWDVYAATAWCEATLNRNYPLALEILNCIPTPTDTSQIVTNLLYFHAKRWDLLLDHESSIVNLGEMSDKNIQQFKDSITQYPNNKEFAEYQQQRIQAEERYKQYLRTLIRYTTGTALAVMGHFDAGVDRLQSCVVDDQYPDIMTRACYQLGLLYRGVNNNDKADKWLSQGISLGNAPFLQAAVKNKDLKLNPSSVDIIATRTDPWDPATEQTPENLDAEKRKATQAALLQEGLRELENLHGMDNVKVSIKRQRNNIQIQQARARKGIKVVEISPHLILTGPPGTGKTTVARIIAKIYSGLGLIKGHHVLETGATDYKSPNIGQTGEKTREVIAKAMDGVLFIDEAYNIIQQGYSKGDPLGQEVVNELLTAMENNRDRLIVIIAGYEDKIDQFLAINDGLSSRFTTRIQFYTYSPEELLYICRLIAKNNEYVLSEEAGEYIVQRLQPLYGENLDGVKWIDKAGNGRFCRNLIEEAIQSAATRLLETDENIDLDTLDVQTLTVPDVEEAFTYIFQQLNTNPH